jgi:hypothetical protein
MPWHDELTLETLLADPLTRLVMRSDNITVDETARAFREAGQALAALDRESGWRQAAGTPYR